MNTKTTRAIVGAVVAMSLMANAEEASALAVAQPEKAGNQKPFVRDVTTGYLLNCSFLSPRPYCWKEKETVMLSGWDVDKSGGNFDYKPTGVYGPEFQFHSEWFKLVDSNATASVALKHQIARQTEGQITLEFRFRMPNLMDGASWQLRDLEKPGVSLLGAGWQSLLGKREDCCPA